MFGLKICVLLCLFSQIVCVRRLLVDQLRWDFLQLENELWNISSNGSLHDEYKMQMITKKFNRFDIKLKLVPKNILRELEPIRKIPDFLLLYSTLQDIENKYEKFRDYQVMMEDIIYDILNNKTGVQNLIDQVYDQAFEREEAIGTQLVKMLNKDFWCKNFQLSPQQLFYNLYNAISLSELKAYMMQQFAYLGNKPRSTSNNAKLSIMARENFKKRANLKKSQFSIAFKIAPADIWRCDPKNYVKGITYDQFTRLLQGHIQNEVDMSPARICRSTCSEYSFTKSYGCYDDESEYCRKVEKCNGNIIGCQFIDSHATICLASRSSPRRYDYIKYESGITLGKMQYCSTKKTVNSWRRMFVRCDYCMCLCDEHGLRSDRYINLRSVMADIKNNRVVTGLRLVKHNRMLHLQIQEGELMPYGYIHESTVHWVKMDDYKITDVGTTNEKDFFTMTYEKRSMELDEIQVNDDNYVVTGVRFQSIKNRVRLEVHVNPFNWYTGKVQQNDGYYIHNNSSKRLQVCLRNADVPVMSDKLSTIYYSNATLYVQFTHTDFYKDAAQTTIPFIDTQEVINKPAVPLMGVGIYYKGTEGYGGFIGPKIKTYDFRHHLTSVLPKMHDRVDV